MGLREISSSTRLANEPEQERKVKKIRKGRRRRRRKERMRMQTQGCRECGEIGVGEGEEGDLRDSGEIFGKRGSKDIARHSQGNGERGF